MSILKNLMVDTKSAWVSFPGFPGFEVEVATLARQELITLRKRCMTTKFVRGQGAEPVLDDDKFIKQFTEATVKNWKGLKYEYLERLMPVDISGVNPDEEMPYTQEDAELLVGGSADFDNWLNEVVFDLENFRSKSKRAPVGEATNVAA